MRPTCEDLVGAVLTLAAMLACGVLALLLGGG